MRVRATESVAELLETLAHECWHERQNMLIKRAITDERTEMDERTKLYIFNITNYVKSTDDAEMYRGQLLEAEAYEFQSLGGKLERLKDEERRRIPLEHVAGIGVYNFLVTLRDNPVEAKKIIEEGFSVR